MARQKALKKSGAATIKIVEDEPTTDTVQEAAPVSDDKPGLGKKFCPHCHAKIAARASTCPECQTAIPPKVKKAARVTRAVATTGTRRQSPSANPSVSSASFEAGIRFLKEVGSLDEAEKTWQIIRKIAGAISTPF